MSESSEPEGEKFLGRLPQPTGWLRLVGTLIALGLLALLLYEQGWDEILAAIRRIEPWRLALALGLMIVSRFAVIARWHTLLQSGNLPVTFRQTTRITFAGLFASNFLPTTIGGDLVRLAGVLQLRLDAAVCTASLIADRLIGMAGMAMAVPLSFPVLKNGLPGAASLTLALAPASNGSGWINRLWQRAARMILRLYGAMRLWLHQPRALLLSLAFTWVNMLCLFSVIELILGGVGESMPFWTIAGLYSLVYFVTLIPISINGYGLQELSMTLIFSNLGRSSVSAGLTAALLFRTLMMLVSLPGALFLPDILSADRQAAKEP